MSHAANVNVICRFRPMNELEKNNGNEQVCVFTSRITLQFYSTREKNPFRPYIPPLIHPTRYIFFRSKRHHRFCSRWI